MNQNIRDVLEDLLFESNLTIVELSNALKMDYKQVSNYVKGIFTPNLKNAITIADYFNCSLDYIAGLDCHRNNNSYSNPDFLFYERYRNLLKDRKVTHYKLSKDLNLNVNDLRNWREGLLPSFKTLIKIAEYLSVSIDEIIGRQIVFEDKI